MTQPIDSNSLKGQRLKPQPVAAGMEKEFVYNYLEQTIMRLDNRDTLREPDFWTEVRKNTIARYGLRNPGSDFDIATCVDLVYAEYIAKYSIKVRKYY